MSDLSESTRATIARLDDYDGIIDMAHQMCRSDLFKLLAAIRELSAALEAESELSDALESKCDSMEQKLRASEAEVARLRGLVDIYEHRRQWDGLNGHNWDARISIDTDSQINEARAALGENHAA